MKNKAVGLKPSLDMGIAYLLAIKRGKLMKKKVWQKKQERKLKLVLRILLAKAYQKAVLAYGIGEDELYCDLFKVSAGGKTTHWYIRKGKVLDKEKWNRIIIAYFRPLIQKWSDCAK